MTPVVDMLLHLLLRGVDRNGRWFDRKRMGSGRWLAADRPRTRGSSAVDQLRLIADEAAAPASCTGFVIS